MAEQHKTDFLSLGQTCDLLDVSLSTIKNWLKTGKIKDDSADGSLKFSKTQIDSIISSRNSLKKDFEEVIELISSGKVNVMDMVSAVYSVDDVADAFDALTHNDGSLSKVLIEVHAE